MANTTENTNSRDDFESQLLELTREMEMQAAMVDSAIPGEEVEDAAEGSPEDAGFTELSGQFKKFTQEISETMGMLVDQLKRKNALESANERLFDAMHGELKSYKDATILEAMQKPFLLDLLLLKDDLGHVAAQLAASVDSCPEPVRPAVHNLDNALHFIDEILSRHSVEEINTHATLDARERRTIGMRHSGDPASTPGDVLEVKRAGYRWRGRVLRPVDVVVEARAEATG